MLSGCGESGNGRVLEALPDPGGATEDPADRSALRVTKAPLTSRDRREQRSGSGRVVARRAAGERPQGLRGSARSIPRPGKSARAGCARLPQPHPGPPPTARCRRHPEGGGPARAGRASRRGRPHPPPLALGSGRPHPLWAAHPFLPAPRQPAGDRKPGRRDTGFKGEPAVC